MFAALSVCTASYVVNCHTGTMLVCWRSTAVPRRAARSSNSKTSSQSPCRCSSRPSSPSTWLSTGACLSTMALASSWPWLSASSLVLSSGAWETKCKLSMHHTVCLSLCVCVTTAGLGHHMTGCCVVCQQTWQVSKALHCRLLSKSIASALHHDLGLDSGSEHLA